MQLMNFVHGGKIVKKTTREDGQFDIQVDSKSAIFKGQCAGYIPTCW